MRRSFRATASPSQASTPPASWWAASSGSTIPAAAASPTARCSAASPETTRLVRRLDPAHLNPQRFALLVHRQIYCSAGHELRAFSRHQRGDGGVLRHHDLLRTALVGEGQLAAARRLHYCRDRRIGHGLIIASVERPVARVERLRKPPYVVGCERAVAALHRGDAEEIARFDLTERDRLRKHDLGLVDEQDVEALAARVFHRER